MSSQEKKVLLKKNIAYELMTCFPGDNNGVIYFENITSFIVACQQVNVFLL